MGTVREQITNASNVIDKNIETNTTDMELLFQNILSQLRNLIEGVIVYLDTQSLESVFTHNNIQRGQKAIKGISKFSVISKFHNLLQKSTSHYTFDADNSQRLMLKYVEYLYRIRALINEKACITILKNLECIKISSDPSLHNYYSEIVTQIKLTNVTNVISSTETCYIHKIKPFFISGNIYYEVTFCHAVNNHNKSDRLIAFTDIDITDHYASKFMLEYPSIKVLNQTISITIIRKWEVSIRPCEINNFARFFGININVNRKSEEYTGLMNWLTRESGSLLDLILRNFNVSIGKNTTN